MARAQYSKVMEVPAAQVWATVRDFGGLLQWMPFLASCELQNGARADQVGARRVVKVKEGPWAEETLRELSDGDCRIVYQLTGGELPNHGALATFTVHEVTADGRSFVEWRIDFDADGDPTATVEGFHGFMSSSLDEMERVLKG